MKAWQYEVTDKNGNKRKYPSDEALSFGISVFGIPRGSQSVEISNNGWQQDVAVMPNPAKGNFSVEYLAVESSDVQCKVYNSLGQEVLSSIEETVAPGRYRINFNNDNIPSGHYSLVLKLNQTQIIKPVVITKNGH